MINTLRIYDELKETFEPSAARKIANVMSLIYEDLQNTVTKTEFSELKDIVTKLGNAQERTEKRVEELATAQGRTEKRVEELATAQGRTEKRVEELATAQERTEKRVEELTIAQKQTETKVEELAEAQRQTEKAIKELVAVQVKSEKQARETRRQLGGLSMTIGYTLENEAYKELPKLLKRDFGILVHDKIKRQYITDNNGNDIEVNILSNASRNGEKIVLVGEAKSQLSKNDINNFIRKKLDRLEGVFVHIFPIIVTHMISSKDVEQYAKQKGIALYYSYDF